MDRALEGDQRNWWWQKAPYLKGHTNDSGSRGLRPQACSGIDVSPFSVSWELGFVVSPLRKMKQVTC